MRIYARLQNGLGRDYGLVVCINQILFLSQRVREWLVVAAVEKLNFR